MTRRRPQKRRPPDPNRLPKDWPKRRLERLRMDRWTCQIQGPRCLAPEPGGLRELEQRKQALVHVDHIRARAFGGGNELGNLRSLCAEDHYDLKRKPPQVRKWL